MARVVLVIDVMGANPTLMDPHLVAEDLTGWTVGDLFTIRLDGEDREMRVESAEWED